MKGLFIYSNFDFSVKSAGATRMLYYAQALATKDLHVYLVTCSSSPITYDSFQEVYPNIYILKNNEITQSFLGTFRFIKNLFDFSKNSFTNYIYIYYPSPLVYLEIISIFYLKFVKKCHIYYELNEIRKYTASFHSRINLKRPKYSIKKITYKFVFSTLESLLCYYDGLICISTNIEAYGKKFNNRTIRIPILTNPNLKIEFSNKIYSQKDSFNIGFSGSIYPTKENLLNFFKVLGKLHKNSYNIFFNMCGQLEKKEDTLILEKLSKELNIETRIKYYGNLNTKELSTFLNQQQLLVIPRGYTLQNNYGFSTKLSDYLNHGKPVLLTNISDNKLFIKDEINGFIVPTDDNVKMYEKLVYIMANYKNIYENIKKNANETSNKSFYYKNFSEILNNFLFERSIMH